MQSDAWIWPCHVRIQVSNPHPVVSTKPRKGWTLPLCYWHELLDLVYFYKATHNMIHLDPSVVPFVRECARRTRISVTSSQSFVPKKCRTSTFQKSFFIRTTRIWNLLITRLDLDNVTFENFKSVLYSYYSRGL